jgi:hypothetical protein
VVFASKPCPGVADRKKTLICIPDPLTHTHGYDTSAMSETITQTESCVGHQPILYPHGANMLYRHFPTVCITSERLPGLAERLFWLNMLEVIHVATRRSWQARTAEHTFFKTVILPCLPHTRCLGPCEAGDRCTSSWFLHLKHAWGRQLKKRPVYASQTPSHTPTRNVSPQCLSLTCMPLGLRERY